MKKELLKKILDDISSVKIVVLGDFCLDAYWFIDETMSEISVETNERTRPVREQRYSPGGAGNVAANLVSIGVKDVRAFGVIGPDPFGTEMIRILGKAGIETRNLIIQDHEWCTHTYAKPYIEDKELNRVDFGNYNKLSKESADLLITRLITEIPEVDAVIINQQVPAGIHTDYFKELLLGLVRRYPDRNFITDSRNFNDYYDGTIRKMNDTEAARLCGVNKKPGESVSQSAAENFAGILFEKFRKPLFITRGNRGSITIDHSGISYIPGLMILSRVDTVGAGDSYLAGAAAALAAGYDMGTSAQTGNFVAGVTVQKLFQTGTATADEILSIGTDPDYIYSPELAEDKRQASYIEDTEIEIINKPDSKLRISYAIFDHDGTISTLRQGWEKIMAPMMVKAILGEKYFTADEGFFINVQERVSEFIDKTTGIQTLAQMRGLLDLIREFGCVPEDDMLDEFGYKRIYNEELIKMVIKREQKLLRNELSIEDLTIKNAVIFLQKLFDAGIKLYLVSGTDEEDTRNEARVLGYDHLFEDRIFGATGDLKKEAKRIVLDRILDNVGEDVSGKIVVFGDGPVEIREAKKRKGITIGIASNELRRFGLNEIKRTRLIKAGADIIIPDYSQSAQLLRLLNIQ